MTETAEITPIAPPREIQYPGFENSMCEVTFAPKDVARYTAIERVLPPEYGERNPDMTEAEGKTALSTEYTRNFDSISFAHDLSRKKQIMVGQTQGEAPSDEMIVARRGPNHEIASYTLTYRAVNDELIPRDLQDEHAGRATREISFVTPIPDAELDPTDAAEAFTGTYFVMAERALGRAPHEFTGTFNDDEIARVDALLGIYSVAGDGDQEVNYRHGLELAGFANRGKFTDPDEEGTYVAYSASLKTVINAAKALHQAPVA